MSFNPNLLDQQSERTEAFAVKVNFGKARFVSSYKHFPGTKENRLPAVEVDEATWATLPPESRIIDLTLEIDTEEPGFDAPFHYTRILKMGSKDWHKIFKKSVEALYGAGSMGKGRYGTTLAKVNEKYVEVADVEVTYIKKTAENPDGEEKTGGYPQLVRVFATREECLAAKQARFASGGSAAAAPVAPAGVAPAAASFPPGWTAETWAASAAGIRAELASGKAPAQVAADYAVPVPFIVALAQ